MYVSAAWRQQLCLVRTVLCRDRTVRTVFHGVLYPPVSCTPLMRDLYILLFIGQHRTECALSSISKARPCALVNCHFFSFLFLRMNRDGEIVGLNSPTNGRACEQHVCCGRVVQAGDLVRFKLGVVTNEDGTFEDAVKVVLIRDGTETCTVGFVPRHIAAVEHKRRSIADKFAQVIELYDLCESAVKKTKSNRNKGMASYRLLDDIEPQE